MTKSQPFVKHIIMSPESYINNVTNNKNELWKTVRLTSFQKPQLQSISIFFKFVYSCFLLYLLCHLYLLLIFLSRYFNVSLNLVAAPTEISWHSSFNPLSPNIHIQILQTDLHTFPLRISWENLINDHGIFSLVIISLILITLLLDNVWIL